MAGQVTLKVRGCEAGKVITLEHTEILYPDGRAHNNFCERPLYVVVLRVAVLVR